MFYALRRYNFAIETFLCNTQYFYIVDSDVYVNNTHINLLIFIATVFTRTSDNVKFYVHFLFCIFYMSVIFTSKYVLLNSMLIYVSA